MRLIHRAAAALAVTAACIVAVPTSAGASGPDDTVHVVEPGDYLLGIARDYDVPLGALLRANDLTVSSLIMPGRTLVIPGSPSSEPTRSAPTAASTGSEAAAATTYTVVAGDALSTIASRHGISLGSLLRANDLRITSVIMPGQSLTIPPGGARVTSTPSGSTPSTPPVEAAPGRTYTVVAGDALFTIAARHGVSLSALLQTNGLSVSSPIFPGRVLQIPAGGSVPSTTTTSTPTSTTTAAASPRSEPVAASTSRAQAVVDFAHAQVGKPYRFFTAGPDTYDCSGLTKAAYAQVGISLIHFSAAQALQGRSVDVSTESILPGDLVFLARRDSDIINHVGIAVGSGRWIHATGPGDTVRLGWMPSKDSIAEVRRFVED